MISRYNKLPLINFLIAGIIGTVLRYYFIHPVPGFDYKNWLQVHSHLMFLGWVTLALFLLILNKLPNNNSTITRWTLILFEISVLALALSFPSAGYGWVSVMFLSLNMAAAFFITYIIFKNSIAFKTTGWRMIRAGLIFMVVSALGPLALGPVSALGLKNSVWYDFAIYFYLHFQYNGWFFLALVGIVIEGMNHNRQEGHPFASGVSSIILTISVILTYLLSLVNHGYPVILNAAGGVGAIAQLFIIIMFISRVVKIPDWRKAGSISYLLFNLSMIALVIKIFLQVISAFPALAEYAFGQRNIIMTYLHLVLIGFISLGVIGLYLKEGWLKQRFVNSLAIYMLIVGFFLNEFVLLTSITGGILILIPRLLFAASLMMTLGIAGIVFTPQRR